MIGPESAAFVANRVPDSIDMIGAGRTTFLLGCQSQV
jgi:hypothetical protein